MIEMAIPPGLNQGYLDTHSQLTFYIAEMDLYMYDKLR
jgi:hypothetical protein